MKLFHKLLLYAVMQLLVICGAHAHDHDDYSAEYNEWAKNQLVTPEAGHRFACPVFSKDVPSCYCCHKSEIVKTQFRSSKQKDADGNWQDEWWWQVPGTANWRKVPNDVIHWGEPTPSEEAVLFLLNGMERCFFPPTGGVQ